jgi:hypothetical protein
MSAGWAWVSGILVSLAIIALLLFGQSERQAYWARRAAVVLHVQNQQAQEQQPDRWVIWRISR